MFWQSNKKIKTFEAWCSDDFPKHLKEPISIDSIKQAENNTRIEGDSLHRAYLKYIKKARDDEKFAIINFSNLQKPIELKFDEPDSPIEEKTTYIWHIGANKGTTLTVVNEKIHSITLSDCDSVYLENCWIWRIHSHQDKHPIKHPTLKLKNCWVGNLSMEEKSLGRLSIAGGRVHSISCPPPQASNPITGPVVISPDVYFPTSPRSRPLVEAQGYRSLRHHLEGLQNSPAANLMRVKELRTERLSGEESIFNRIVNWTYDDFSEYGNSPGRPLRLMLEAYILVVLLLFHFGAVSLGLSENNYYGWQHVLSEVGWTGELGRAIVLPAQSFLSPFGAFAARKLVVASHWWWQLLIVVHAIFSYLLLLMAILGIRKRFKLP